MPEVKERHRHVQNYAPSPGGPPLPGAGVRWCSQPAPQPSPLGANVTHPAGLGNSRGNAKTGGNTESPSDNPAGE